MKHLLLTLVALLLAQPCFAVTRDTVTTGRKGNSGTTLTVSHTVTAAGGNRAIYLLCGLRSRTITASATYGGEAMTAVRDTDTHGSTNIRSYIWRLLDPTTGANDWQVTQSSGTAMACWALSATDVHQTVPETDSDGACGSGDPSVTLTTATDELLLDVMAQVILGSATPGANQNEEYDEQTTENTLTVSGTRQDGADGGVMSQTQSSANVACYSAVAVAHSDFSTNLFGPLRRR